MMLKKLSLPAGAILILVLLGLGYQSSQAGRPCKGCPAPDLDLMFYDGYEWNNKTQTTLSDFQGNIIVLNFWASWCGPCRQEAEWLEQTWRTYADDGVIFVGVAWSDTDRKAYAFLEEFGITYPNAPDIGLQAKESYRFVSVPETFFIDEEGMVFEQVNGAISEAVLQEILDTKLGK